MSTLSEYATALALKVEQARLASQRLAELVPLYQEMQRAGQLGQAAWGGYQQAVEPTVLGKIREATNPLAQGILEAAGNDMTGGLPLGAGLGMIRAFHGTPHLFDTYDLSKIGTGEGAQVKGYGFYSAENIGTAQSYEEMGSKARALIDDEWADLSSFAAPGGPDAVRDMATLGYDAAKRILKKLTPATFGQKYIDTYAETLEQLKGHTVTSKRSGVMQSVVLRPDKTDLLDLDKPLTQQSASVKKRLRGITEWLKEENDLDGPYAGKFREDMTGEELYRVLGKGRMDSPEAADVLLSAGIPGNKFLDQGSRFGSFDVKWAPDGKRAAVYTKDGQLHKTFDTFKDADAYVFANSNGTYNFVMFRPEDIVVDAVNGYQLAPGSSRVSPFVGPYRPGAWVDEAKPVKATKRGTK